MSNKPNKLYSEWKQDLSKAFYKVANHPEYINKTYSGRNFVDAIFEWEDAWFGLIYHSTDIAVEDYWEKPSCFKYKLSKWSYWDHEFNRMLWDTCKKEDPLPVRCPEFLDGMFEITQKFLACTTHEEESKALDTTYRVVLKKEEKHYLPNSTHYTSDRTWATEKHVWLTEENVGTKSNMLPRYASYDLTEKLRGRKLYNYYRRTHKDNAFLTTKELIDDAKEVWRVYRLAIKKGILVDNYEKGNRSK